MNVQIHQGDTLELLKKLPGNSIDCIVTSPPYYGLRDYDAEGQIGLEESFALYLRKLLSVTKQLHRVLKPTGTCWINMGDAYSGSWGGQGCPTNLGVAHNGVRPTKSPSRNAKEFPRKCLMGQPWRLAIAMVDKQGWILRQDIIWVKPSAMPESAKDRATTAHEHIFHFAKRQSYYYDYDAVAEPRLSLVNRDKPASGWDMEPGAHSTLRHNKFDVDAARSFNRRRGTLPDSYQGEIDLGGSNSKFRKSHAPGSGQPQTQESRAEASGRMGREPGWRQQPQLVETRNQRSVWKMAAEPYRGDHSACFPSELPKRCILAGCPEGGIVLDPFAGTGTTLQVAVQLGRQAIGIELNPEYIEMIHDRLRSITPGFNFAEVSA